MPREGLKITEVYEIAREVKANLEVGETEDVAYALGCRILRTATTPESLKAWKTPILKLAKGERVKELEDAVLPAKIIPTPPGASVYANLDAARAEAEKAKNAHGDALKEIERLKAELAKKK